MMTLEEAIKAEEAETLAYEECLNSLDDNMPTDMWNELNKSLGKQMDYHRQLAEWLRELKALKENEDVKDVFKNCETCKYRDIDDTYGYTCNKCMHRYRNQYVYDDTREVNADGDSN